MDPDGTRRSRARRPSRNRDPSVPLGLAHGAAPQGPAGRRLGRHELEAPVGLARRPVDARADDRHVHRPFEPPHRRPRIERVQLVPWLRVGAPQKNVAPVDRRPDGVGRVPVFETQRRLAPAARRAPATSAGGPLSDSMTGSQMIITRMSASGCAASRMPSAEAPRTQTDQVGERATR